MRAFLIFLLLTVSSIVFSQPTNLPPEVNIKKTSEKITIDGQLTEATWMKCELVTNFNMHEPFDTAKSENKTIIRLTYDDNNLYISAECFDELEGNYVVQSLKRDFSYPKSDAFAIYLDPFMDQTNGFSFAVNPLGVQREGLLQNGGAFGVTTSWDNEWYSAVKKYNDKWIAEVAIPFKSIKFKEGEKQWRVNFSRHDLKRNENSVWSHVPTNLNVSNLGFTGFLNWDEAPVNKGGNVVLIPYATASTINDIENSTSRTKANTGLEAKVAIGSGMNLDLTVNPDFSQVDVDAQVIDLDRFSIFFPERREFFIENSDLFSNYGFSRIRPFFSRRIGLAKGNPVPILGGARLSGKPNQNWRVGALNMQTEGIGELEIAPQNYSVLTAQRKVLKRSNVGAIIVNRQGFKGSEVSKTDYNRVIGGDFNYFSANNKWKGKAFLHKSFTDGITGNDWAQAVWLQYQNRNWEINYNHEFVGDNYQADAGFVRRKGIVRFEEFVAYKFYPKAGNINNHGPSVFVDIYLDQNWSLLDRQYNLGYNINYQSKSAVVFGINSYKVNLTNSFDASGSGGLQLPMDEYNYENIYFKYQSDFRKKLFYKFDMNVGEYYNGTRENISGGMYYRIQPYGFIGFDAQQTSIRLQKPYPVAIHTLIGPNIELSLTKSVFWSTFLQYNTQADNFNVNSRVQWRFKPMSDLFLVYTDNYFIENFGEKNRALVLKVNYWLNL